MDFGGRVASPLGLRNNPIQPEGVSYRFRVKGEGLEGHRGAATSPYKTPFNRTAYQEEAGMRDETRIFWTDQFERAYAVLTERGGHWHVAWGYRDPPGSDNLVQEGERSTSDRDEAVEWLREQVQAHATGAHDVAQLERDLATLEPLAEGGEKR